MKVVRRWRQDTTLHNAVLERRSFCAPYVYNPPYVAVISSHDSPGQSRLGAGSGRTAPFCLGLSDLPPKLSDSFRVLATFEALASIFFFIPPGGRTISNFELCAFINRRTAKSFWWDENFFRNTKETLEVTVKKFLNRKKL